LWPAYANSNGFPNFTNGKEKPSDSSQIAEFAKMHEVTGTDDVLHPAHSFNIRQVGNDE
jgi:hypothetical protein